MDMFGFEYNPQSGMRDLLFILVIAVGSSLFGLFPEIGSVIPFFILGAVAAGDIYIDRRPLVDVCRYGLRLTAAFAAVLIVWKLGSLPSYYAVDATPLTWGRVALVAAICFVVYNTTAFGISFALWFNGTPRPPR